ncbi:MICOS complex subunit Mic25-like [Plodia interpunctella]|uniref:MICOS complex subunit Mic25-like n=1 Tax=Plodia interpunctella TaxID=58824 RepID=UPI002368E56C|nr:MICOS complex subunit Mic25-like [Plodia interpunctella]
MGTIASKGSGRRISFDNNFVVSPAIVPKCMDCCDDILELESLSKDADDELHLKETNSMTFESQENNDGDYWSRRIENLKKEHQSINKIIETEYEKTVENTKIYDTPANIHDKMQKIKPCFDWRAKILKCYEENPHQQLLCSAAVQAFSQCVKNCRMED